MYKTGEDESDEMDSNNTNRKNSNIKGENLYRRIKIYKNIEPDKNLVFIGGSNKMLNFN
jgi:hypothetical protein